MSLTNQYIKANLSNHCHRITGIRDDAATLTTYLTAQPAAWSDVAGTYDLDFGRAAMPRPGPQRRGLFDFLGDASDFLLHGDIDLDKSANFPTVLGTPGQNHSIINTPKSVVTPVTY